MKLKRQMTVLGGATPFLFSREYARHLFYCLVTSVLLYYGMFTPCFTRTVSLYEYLPVIYIHIYI